MTYLDCCCGPALLVFNPTSPTPPASPSAGAVRNGYLELSPPSSKPTVITVRKESETPRVGHLAPAFAPT